MKLTPPQRAALHMLVVASPRATGKITSPELDTVSGTAARSLQKLGLAVVRELPRSWRNPNVRRTDVEITALGLQVAETM